MSTFDAARLDLRGAFDFAIMVEEDSQLRYEQFSRLLAADPGGAADVFRAMAVNEAKHRADLEARRAAVFRDAPARVEVSVLDAAAVEVPDVDASELPRTAADALRLALAAEQRAFDFYRGALARVSDPGVRWFFQQLMDEEAEHLAFVAAKLSQLEGSAARAPAAAAAPTPPRPREDFPDRAQLEAMIPRFDAATQAVAERVIVAGMAQEEVAAALGVSRRTVALKLARFLGVARQHLAVALAAAALAGCNAGVDAQDASPSALAAPAATAPGAGAREAAPAGGDVARSATWGAGNAAGVPGASAVPPGAVNPFSRTPPAAELQSDGTPLKPQLARVSPDAGPPDGGDQVVITGSGFANVQVMFGDAVARVVNQSSNAITVAVPQGTPGPRAVVVTNRDGTYAVAGAAYTYR